ncbi:MAG: DUF11 domain-containing protein [Candidatus Peribacteraceae bacterium]|nr:DUF11 domain-containing protein [Candidatus Peribacteraceae bacterium]
MTTSRKLLASLTLAIFLSTTLNISAISTAIGNLVPPVSADESLSALVEGQALELALLPSSASTQPSLIDLFANSGQDLMPYVEPSSAPAEQAAMGSAPSTATLPTLDTSSVLPGQTAVLPLAVQETSVAPAAQEEQEDIVQTAVLGGSVSVQGSTAVIVSTTIGSGHAPIPDLGGGRGLNTFFTEHWTGVGSKPAQLVISNLQAGDQVTISGMRGTINWGGGAGLPNPSSCLGNGVQHYPKLVATFQFVNSARQVVAIPGGGMNGSNAIPANLFSTVVVPSGAVALYGSFPDSKYNDNYGNCGFNVSVVGTANPPASTCTSPLTLEQVKANIAQGKIIIARNGSLNSVSITNNTDCSFPVTHASFNVLTGGIQTQIDERMGTVAPRSTYPGTLTVPSCGAYQLDVWYGNTTNANNNWPVNGLFGEILPGTVCSSSSSSSIPTACTLTLEQVKANIAQGKISFYDSETQVLVKNDTDCSFPFTAYSQTNGQQFDIKPATAARNTTTAVTLATPACGTFDFDAWYGQTSEANNNWAVNALFGNRHTRAACSSSSSSIPTACTLTLEQVKANMAQGKIIIARNGSLNSVSITNNTDCSFPVTHASFNVLTGGIQTQIDERMGTVAPRSTYPGTLTVPSCGAYQLDVWYGNSSHPNNNWSVNGLFGEILPGTVCSSSSSSSSSSIPACTLTLEQVKANMAQGKIIIARNGSLNSVSITNNTDCSFPVTHASFNVLTGGVQTQIDERMGTVAPRSTYPGTLTVPSCGAYQLDVWYGNTTNANNNWPVNGLFGEILPGTVCQTQLSLTKTAPTSVTRGGQLVYTINVYNNGSVTANNVSVQDAFPGALAYVQNGSSSECSKSLFSNTITCNGFNLTAGASKALTLVFSVPTISNCSVSQSISNTAQVSAGNMSQTVTSNMVQTTISCNAINQPNLSLTKSAPVSVIRGNTLTYNLSIYNTGNAAANNVQIADQFPADLEFNPALSTPGCINNSGVIHCTFASIAANTSQSVSLTFNAPTIANCTAKTLSNTAALIADGVPQVTSNTVTTALNCPVIITNPNLSITKTAPSAVTRGGQLTYTIAVANNGNGDANNVIVIDNFPAGLIFNAQNKPSFCNKSTFSNTITCDIAKIQPAQTALINLTFDVPTITSCSTQSISNVASVSADGVAQMSSAPAATTLNCPVIVSPTLSITKTAATTVTRGGQLIYTVSVYNNGSVAATNVTVQDSFPSELTYVQTGSSAECSKSLFSNTITCNGFNLTVGASKALTLVFNVPTINNCTSSVSISNTAQALADNMSQAVYSTPANTTINCNVINQPILSIAKTAPVNIVRSNSTTISYSVAVYNAGNAAATNVVVLDQYPTTLQYNAALSSPGCIDQSGTVRCELAQLNAQSSQAYTLTFNIPTQTTCSQISLTNTARVSATGVAEITSAPSVTTVTCPTATQATLAISKVGPPSVNAGDKIAYMLTVSNTSTIDAQSVVIADPIPAGGLVFVQSESTAGCSAQMIGTTNTIVCVLGTVAAGQQKQVQLVFTVPTNTTVCDGSQRSILNIAAVNGANAAFAQSQTVSSLILCPAAPNNNGSNNTNSNTNTFNPVINNYSYNTAPPSYPQYAYNYDQQPVYQQPVYQPVVQQQQQQQIVQQPLPPISFQGYVMPQTGSDMGGAMSLMLTSMSGLVSAFGFGRLRKFFI